MSFFLSKFLWYFINPFSLFIFLFLIGLIFLVFKKHKKAFYILSLTFFSLLLVSIFPIGKYAINVLEKDYHLENKYPNNVDGILILAGATDPYLSKEYNSIELNDSAERLLESVFLIQKYKNAKIIFSGGSGYLNYPNLDHAKIAKNFFNKMKIENKNIIYENKSRNTYENILFSKQIAKPQEDEKWLLVTSAFHMKRAILISKKQKWKFIPYPVDFKQSKKISLKPSIHFFSNFTSFQKAFHEWLGLFSYYLMGRTDNFF